MKMKRLLTAAMLVVALGLATTSATASRKASNQITFMVAEYSTKTVPFWKETVKAFEHANPGMKVNLRTVGWQQNHDTTAQMIAADKLPDLVNTATIWLPEWVQANAIMPMSNDIVSPAIGPAVGWIRSSVSFVRLLASSFSCRMNPAPALPFPLPRPASNVKPKM